MPVAADHLYESTADKVSGLIESGAFRRGGKVPSVRRLARELQVSVSTAVAAYRLLERRGVLEPRARSGYYVAATPAACLCPEPGESRPPRRAGPVNLGEIAVTIIRDAQNPKLLQLGAAVPNPALLPLDALRRTMARVARLHRVRAIGSYDTPEGCRELRVALARRSLQLGLALAPDDFVTTAGCLEAIHLALLAVARPGDTIAVESPAYFGTLQALSSLGLRALEIPTHPKDGMSLAALREALDSRPVRACLVNPTCQNPLGFIMDEARRRELVAMLAAREIPLIEDDICGELSYSGERPQAAKAFDRKGLVLYCGSLSKSLAPGWRVGWIAPGRFRDEVQRLKTMTTVATAALPQLAAAEFLESGAYDRHLRRFRAANGERAHALGRDVARLFPPGTRATRPEGGFVLWVELPPRVDALALYERARRAGFTIAPGPIFSSGGTAYRNFVRLNAAFYGPESAPKLALLGKIAGGILSA